MKLTESITEFVQNLVDLGRSPATITAYKQDLLQLNEFLTGPEVSQITSDGIQSFLTEMGKQGYSAKSTSRKLNSIKSLFRFLLQRELVLIDPSLPVPHPTFDNKLPRVLSETEYRSLRDTARTNLKTYTLIELMLQTGLRIGEISRLKLEHIQIKSNPPQILIGEFASTPMRLVELNDSAAEVIKTYLPHRANVQKDKGFFFNTKNGGGMNIRNIRSVVNRVFSKAGVKQATVNDLRNTFIVQQLEHGVSIEKVSQVVGHRRYSSTEKYLPLLKRIKPGKRSKLITL